MTDTRDVCLFMCQQCAVLWQGWHLASLPWKQRSVHCPALHHVGATEKSVCSISRGRGPESSPWIFFIYLFNLLNNPLFPHTNLFPQELCQPMNGLPRLLLHFCQGKLGWGLQCLQHYFLCWCEMTNLSSTSFIFQTFSWHWQNTPTSFKNALLW